jgi:O-antigen/teichoic acid export membrane protein
VVSARALGVERYASLSVLWALVFLVGPGFFLPFEQELGRTLAARRARNVGGRPVILRAAAACAGLTVLLLALTAVASRPLLEFLLGDEFLLLVALAAALAAYACEFVVRGTLSGNGRFGAYGMVIGSEGAVRLLAAVALAVVGVDEVGPYGLALGLAPFVATAIGMRGQRGLATPGPESPWSELSSALGLLLAASLLAQLLINAGPLAVRILAGPDEQAEAGRFLAGVVIARVPLFLFQAVQAALIPKLSALAAAGKLAEFRHGLRQLLLLFTALGVASTLGCLAVGPELLALLFGEGFELGRVDLGYLAAASATYIIALSLAQALISLAGYARVTLAWVAGIATFVVVVAMVDDLLLRVELGFLAGSTVAAFAMGALLLQRLGTAHDQRVVDRLPASGVPVEP